MTTLPFYQVDAGASRAFEGNPAAVIPLAEWLDDAVMLSIAAENNLSETAFFVPSAGGGAEFDLRWFTPTVEVDLCGHATLAAAHVLDRDRVRFATRSGVLTVDRADGLLWLDMPVSRLSEAVPGGEAEALGQNVLGVWSVSGGNGGAVMLLEDEAALRAATPDFGKVATCANGFIMATAPGDDVDFVSRVFCPTFGIDEDPVTGSAHAALTPFWAGRLGKERMTAIQASRRSGRLECLLRGERVVIGTACRTVITGEFHL